jgi:hypothetical protein
LPFTEEGRPRRDAGPQQGENEGHEEQPPPVVLSSDKEEEDKGGRDKEDKNEKREFKEEGDNGNGDKEIQPYYLPTPDRTPSPGLSKEEEEVARHSRNTETPAPTRS